MFEHFLGADHYNPGFGQYPLIIGAHAVSGAIYLACGMTQFVGQVRARWPAVHRATGPVAIASGVVAGVTAIAITVLIPFHGPAAMYWVMPFAVLFIVALVTAFERARPISLVSFVAAFLLHLAVAEAWIRYTRVTAVQAR